MTSISEDSAQLDWVLDCHELVSLADAPDGLVQLSVTGRGEDRAAVQRPLMQFYAGAGGPPHPIAQCI